MRAALLWQCFCSALGLTMIASGLTKWRNPDQFREVAAGYSLPRRWRLSSFAWLVAPLELLLGGALLSLERVLTFLGVLGTLAFLAASTCLVAARWRAGESRFRCGCGTDLREEHSAAVLLARNALLIGGLTLALLLLIEGEAAPARPGVLPVYLSGFSLVLVGALAGRALFSWRAIREWKGLGSSRI